MMARTQGHWSATIITEPCPDFLWPDEGHAPSHVYIYLSADLVQGLAQLAAHTSFDFSHRRP